MEKPRSRSSLLFSECFGDPGMASRTVFFPAFYIPHGAVSGCGAAYFPQHRQIACDYRTTAGHRLDERQSKPFRFGGVQQQGGAAIGGRKNIPADKPLNSTIADVHLRVAAPAAFVRRSASRLPAASERSATCLRTWAKTRSSTSSRLRGMELPTLNSQIPHWENLAREGGPIGSRPLDPDSGEQEGATPFDMTVTRPAGIKPKRRISSRVATLAATTCAAFRNPLRIRSVMARNQRGRGWRWGSNTQRKVSKSWQVTTVLPGGRSKTS